MEKEGEKVEIVCLSCKKTIKVVLITFGSGHAVTCPECKKLAYNGK